MKPVGILIIHGTLGSPLEYRELAATLSAQGYLPHTVSLPGHGDDPAFSLGEVRAEQLLQHCREEYEKLSEACDEMVIIGHSLGGILTLLTAAQNPDKLRGVMAFSAPYEHAYFVNHFHGFLEFSAKHFMPGLLYAPQGYTGYKSPMFMPWWFPQMYQEATHLLKQLQVELSNIDVPVHLAHSPYDMIVPYAEMEKLARNIGKPHLVSTYTFEQCGHQIFPNSKESDTGTRLVLDFLKQHTAKARPQAVNS